MNKRYRYVLISAALVAATSLSGCGKTPQASAHIADIDVTENVKAALKRDEVLKNANITVVTLKGDVRLSGTLDNQAQIDEAIKLARASDGAHTIHDELTIKK